MSRLEKEAAKNARNTPKAVSTPAPFTLQAVESEQAPTAGIPSVRAVPTPIAPLTTQAVKTEQTPTTGIPPVPVPLDPAILPQDIETACFTTAESTTPPLQAVAPVQVPLTGAQTTVANTARNLLRNSDRLLKYRQGLMNPERLASWTKSNAARTAVSTLTTRAQHLRLQKVNLAALLNANSEHSTFQAPMLKGARILAIRASVARRIKPSVLRASVVQELDAHLLCITRALLAPFSLRMLFYRISLTAPSPTRKRMQAPDPTHLYKAATRRLNAATLDRDYLLKEQKRLTATQDGPFLDPGSTPTVLALPFVPPSWAAVMTGGYRHHRIRRHLHANHPPSRKETIRRTCQSSCKGVSTRRHNNACFASRAEFRCANRCKTPRSCAGPHNGHDRRPHSGSFRPSPSHSYAPARPYRPDDGRQHRERDDDDRGGRPPPRPPPYSRGGLPHFNIRCHYSDHEGQCERHCRLEGGRFRHQLVRKHTTLTFCNETCMGAFLVNERSELISQPWPPHFRASADDVLREHVLKLLRAPCPDSPGGCWPLRSILNRTVYYTAGMNLQESLQCNVFSRFLLDLTNEIIDSQVHRDELVSLGLLRWATKSPHQHLFRKVDGYKRPIQVPPR